MSTLAREGFEDGITGWSDTTSGSALAQSSAYALDGTYSLEVVPPGGVVTATVDQPHADATPCTPGEPYSVSVWVLIPTSAGGIGPDGFRAGLIWYDSGGAVLAVSNGAYRTIPSEEEQTWIERTASGVAPASAARVGVRIDAHEGADLGNPDTFYVDHITVSHTVRLLPGEVDGYVSLDIAWGADLTADPSTWDWTGITRDVRYEDGPTEITLGRSDEAATSQPGQLTLALDNSTGDYSLGPQSANHPYVRRNTPVRFRIDPDGGGYTTAFQGYATGFTPSWDLTGTIPVVELVASGALRRIQQRKSPTLSALTRHLAAQTDLVAWWPLEEGREAEYGVPVIGSGPFLFWQFPDLDPPEGKIAWGKATDNPAVLRAPELAAGGGLLATVKDVPANGWTIAWTMRVAAAAGGHCIWRTDDDEFTVSMLVYTDGSLEVFLSTGPLSSEVVLTHQFDTDDYDDVWHWYALTVRQDGSSVVFQLDIDGDVIDAHIESSETMAAIRTVEYYSEFDVTDPVAVGHVIILDADDYTATRRATLATVAAAHVGENAISRLERLCAEHDVPLTVTGTTTTTMGPQFPDEFLPLIRECETGDQGLLYDGVGAGLAYLARDQRENGAAALTIDVAAHQLAPGFRPVDDDQRNVNQVKAQQREVSSVVYEDTTGPLGTATIGLYDDDLTVNIDTPSLLRDYAAWRVHLGTVPGYRYPATPLNLHATPELAGQWLAVTPSARIDITNPANVLTGHPLGDISLLVEGTEQSIAPAQQWTATAKCSRFQPWRITVLAEDSGDTDPFLCHLDTDDSELAASVSAGATSLSVTTNAGPLWTTDPDDTPFDIEVGGHIVTVTAISGASSPQTFTVDPVPHDLAAGDPISVHQPTALGL